MKHCVNCEYMKLEVINQNGRAGRIPFCTHEECSNPVTGEMLPCEIVRAQDSFCGLGAKYFQLKEVKPEPEKSLIAVK